MSVYNFNTIMNIARLYASLGDSVQDQLNDILNGRYEDINSNAFRDIKVKLGGHVQEIDVVINEYEEWCERFKKISKSRYN